ncbi:MAG: carotenoid biosynthesis protein [Chloroflexia bacterium]|nr:carotenoid biosynthesis protein [Chloroflexia bacterium]
MRIAKILLVAHVSALVFGLMGLLYVIPNLALFAGDSQAMQVYAYGLEYAGSLHIILGAAAMFAYGIAAIGLRRTGLFFAFAVPYSLLSELIGTGTGWPFGNYAYTSYLGYKVLDHVPFSIPLSWFYVGFASFLLGSIIAGNAGWKAQALLSVALGVWFLTVWDLVLDPAMAHEAMAIRFWEWNETGPYMGMPVKNFVGWSLTGAVFMSLARWAWNGAVDSRAAGLAPWFPFTVYTANTIFAMALSASVGLWGAIVLALALGIIPATSALRRHRAPRQVAATETLWQPAPSR